MTEHTPKFLVAHFDGDFLEDAQFAISDEEAEQISCAVRLADHWSMVKIPIETAVAAPELLKMCGKLANIAEVVGHCVGTWTPEHQALAQEYAAEAREIIAKATTGEPK